MPAAKTHFSAAGTLFVILGLIFEGWKSWKGSYWIGYYFFSFVIKFNSMPNNSGQDLL